LYRVPISSVCTYPFPDEKNFDSTKKNYLWLGSTDFIHKGLDLVVDAFSEMSDYHLYICGPIEREKMFAKAYQNELYELPNIHTIGWTDVTGNEFINLTKKCVGVIYPSCSEGGGAEA